jgi:hypothetical protein
LSGCDVQTVEHARRRDHEQQGREFGADKIVAIEAIAELERLHALDAVVAGTPWT